MRYKIFAYPIKTDSSLKNLIMKTNENKRRNKEIVKQSDLLKSINPPGSSKNIDE